MPYNSKYYRANKQYYLDKNRLKRQKMAEYVRQVKASKPCTDCGKRYAAYVMDFDHRDPGLKVAIISRIAYAYSWKRLHAELEECDLVCANCHRLRTFERARDIAETRLGKSDRKPR